MNRFWTSFALLGISFAVSVSCLNANENLLSSDEVRSITTFLHKKPKSFFTKKKGMLSPKLTKLKYPIEQDPRTGRVYVYLKGHPDAALGKGYFKQVSKALLYQTRKSTVPRIVACCHTQKSTNEINALKKFQGIPGIVKLYSTFKRSGSVADIMIEYCNEGSLLKCEYRKIAISDSDCLSYFEDVLLGLNGIHARKHLHRDLHGGNILLKRESSGRLGARIIDFGQVKAEKDMIGTDASRTIPRYLAAPELLLYRRDQVDPITAETYALGVTLYTGLNSRRPKWCKLVSEIFSKPSKKKDRRKVYHEVVRLWNESRHENQTHQKTAIRRGLNAECISFLVLIAELDLPLNKRCNEFGNYKSNTPPNNPKGFDRNLVFNLR